MTDQPPTVFDMMIAELSVGDYAPIRYAYKMTVAGLVREYLYASSVKVVTYTNAFKRAIQESFYPAFEQGLTDGGGEPPAQDDDLKWINARAEAERGYAEMLFQSLKELKAQAKEDGTGIFEGVPEARAEGYAKTLDAVYSEGKIRGARNMMLTFGGDDGDESCATCQKLKGQRHRANWWKNKGLIPGQPGNSNFKCGGYQCRHYLYNDKGEVFNV